MNSKAYAFQVPIFALGLGRGWVGPLVHSASPEPAMVGSSSRKRQRRYPGSLQSPAPGKTPDTAQAPFRDDEKGPGFPR